MQTLNFPCPLCGRRMGVGADLGGKPVRCPHCRQVIVSPAGGELPPTEKVPVQPQPAEVHAAVPDFSHLPKREVAESIFAEGGSDDESVFDGSVAARVVLPEPPEPLQPTEKILRQPEFLAPLKPDAAAVSPETFKATQQTPRPLPNRTPAATPAVGVTANPWARLEDTCPDMPSPVPMSVPIQPTATVVPQAVSDPNAERVQQLRRVVFALAVYAAAATLAAAYLGFRVLKR